MLSSENTYKYPHKPSCCEKLETRATFLLLRVSVNFVRKPQHTGVSHTTRNHNFMQTCHSGSSITGWVERHERTTYYCNNFGVVFKDSVCHTLLLLLETRLVYESMSHGIVDMSHNACRIWNLLYTCVHVLLLL